MKLPIEVSYVQVPLDKLMPYYKQEEVLGYCQRCNNYGNNHSCPQEAFKTKAMLEPYTYATVILTKIDTGVIRENEALFQDHIYDSRVYDNYIKDKKNLQYDWQTGLSMFAFDHVKDWMTDKLLDAETLIEGSLSLPPGSCTRCETCVKKVGQACVSPEKLRYSFEALGFLVSDIYKEVLEIELGWTKGQLSEAFHTCSALLTKEALSSQQLEHLEAIVGNKTMTVWQTLQSKRLELRPFKSGDAQDLFDYLSREEVVKYEPYGVHTLEMSQKKAEDRSRNDAFYAVVLRETGKLIGNIYFNRAQPSFVNTYELGYVFNPDYAGKGYATEAAKCVVDNAFKVLKAHRVIANCSTQNVQSWKLLERLEMRREATRLQNMYFDTDKDGQPLWFDSYQYAILKREWLYE